MSRAEPNLSNFSRAAMTRRITWEQLPQTVRDGVESILTEPVVAAVSAPGGFSPGSADRVLLASGRRAFVKAASALENATTPVLHRREAAGALALPQDIPAPEFLGMYDFWECTTTAPGLRWYWPM
ncbi:hypothetical protein [Arthrobacter sp. lap29]|uniref:hypothetical protein n=1 Tax=Arthrobacter sp. lap29 TaxID=3056122 RepID=UPI0028F6E8F2|nr:hypothetical protein [Arthrobacter sp. lap29]